jgi:hypothetical protein
MGQVLLATASNLCDRAKAYMVTLVSNHDYYSYISTQNKDIVTVIFDRLHHSST